MFLDWINHPSFHRHEQLMVILFDVGFATLDQLTILTGWSEKNIQKYLYQLRKTKPEDERIRWIEPFSLPNSPLKRKPKAAYRLGDLGLQYVHQMMEADIRTKEAMPSQIHHYLGINNIAIRLLQRGVDRSDIQWISSFECTGLILEYWKRLASDTSTSKKRQLSRPDAMLVLNKRRYWIEFDNSTEKTRKLERKFHRYFNTITPEGLGKIHRAFKHPVIWVTIDDKRRKALEQTWESMVKAFYHKPGLILPEMKFYVEGEETDYFLTTPSIKAPSDVRLPVAAQSDQ